VMSCDAGERISHAVASAAWLIRNPAECSGNTVVSALYLVRGIPVALKRGVLDAVCVAAMTGRTNRLTDSDFTD
jgi:hypothetical protein